MIVSKPILVTKVILVEPIYTIGNPANESWSSGECEVSKKAGWDR